MKTKIDLKWVLLDAGQKYCILMGLVADVWATEYHPPPPWTYTPISYIVYDMVTRVQTKSFAGSQGELYRIKPFLIAIYFNKKNMIV